MVANTRAHTCALSVRKVDEIVKETYWIINSANLLLEAAPILQSRPGTVGSRAGLDPSPSGIMFAHEPAHSTLHLTGRALSGLTQT